MILVLDEFHVLDSASISQSLSFLLKHLPRNLHLVIASRTEPALDMAFLRAKGRVLELGVDELRFNHEEIALFLLETTGFQFSLDIIETLEQKTDGWITGLQMAAISLQHRPDPSTLLANLQGDTHYLVDFLAEEVLNRQAPDTQAFLLQTAILDRLTGPLCDALTGRQDGAAQNRHDGRAAPLRGNQIEFDACFLEEGLGNQRRDPQGTRTRTVGDLSGVLLGLRQQLRRVAGVARADVREHEPAGARLARHFRRLRRGRVAGLHGPRPLLLAEGRVVDQEIRTARGLHHGQRRAGVAGVDERAPRRRDPRPGDRRGHRRGERA